MESHHAPKGIERAVRWYAQPRPQAIALAGVLATEGLLTFAVGGPLWAAALYVGLGVVLGLARIRWGRRRRRPIPPRAPASAAPAPGRSAPAALAPAPVPPARFAPAAFAPAPVAPAPVAPAPAAPAAPVADGAVQVAPARRVALGYIALAARADAVALGTHRAAIGAYAKAHNLDLTTVVHDVPRRPGASDGRPALRWALGRIAAGEAQVLVVAQLAHLSDTVADLSPLLRWFATDGRALVVVDIRLDTSTQAGRLAATALDGVGGLDRIQAAPEPSSVGAASPPRRPAPRRAAVADLPDLQLRIAALREQGMTLQAIADLLNEEGVPTVRGGTMWRASSVQRATGYQRPPRARRGIEVPRARPE